MRTRIENLPAGRMQNFTDRLISSSCALSSRGELTQPWAQLRGDFREQSDWSAAARWAQCRHCCLRPCAASRGCRQTRSEPAVSLSWCCDPPCLLLPHHGEFASHAPVAGAGCRPPCAAQSSRQGWSLLHRTGRPVEPQRQSAHLGSIGSVRERCRMCKASSAVLGTVMDGRRRGKP